jgi:hypothetical protein
VNACVHTYTEPQTSSTRSRGLGRRIHESVEDTKLSTNKQHSLSLKAQRKRVTRVGSPYSPVFPNIMSCLRSPITAKPRVTH